MLKFSLLSVLLTLILSVPATARDLRSDVQNLHSEITRDLEYRDRDGHYCYGNLQVTVLPILGRTNDPALLFVDLRGRTGSIRESGKSGETVGALRRVLGWSMFANLRSGTESSDGACRAYEYGSSDSFNHLSVVCVYDRQSMRSLGSILRERVAEFDKMPNSCN